MMTWACLGFLSVLVRTSTSLAWSLISSSPEKTICVVLFAVSLRALVFWCWWNVYFWTPALLIVAIMHLFSKSSSIVRLCGCQLTTVTFSFLSARYVFSCQALVHLDQWFSSLCMLSLCMLHKVNSNSNHCLYSEFSSASTRIRPLQVAVAAQPWSLESQSAEPPNLQGCSSRPKFVWIQIS